MIRPIKLGDHPQIAELIRKAWAKGSYSQFEIDDDLLLRTIHGYMSDAQSCGFVHDDDGVLRGVIAGALSRLPIAREKCAHDTVFYCESGRGAQLISAFVEWAESKNAQIIGMSVSSGSKRAGRLIKSKGFNPVGGLYYRVKSDE